MKFKLSILFLSLAAAGLGSLAFFEVTGKPKPCPANQRCFNFDPSTGGGVKNTIIPRLPKGKPTCCEHEWTVRINIYHPDAAVPRRMYMAACQKNSSSPNMFVSLALGKNKKHPKPDPSSGAIIQSRLNPATGKLEQVGRARHFPECIWMEGIAVSEDCNTIAALCRRRYGDRDFDYDSLSTHSAKKWMTQPKCAKHEMWMYEWKNGDIHSKPRKYVVHRAMSYDWEYGNNYLRMGNDGTYGIAMKARVFGGGGCHEADAFLVMDRKSHKFTNRGWSWACGTGHTLFNRPAFNPATGKYALMCGTDGSTHGGPLGGFWIRREDRPSKEFYYTSYAGIRIKGGPGPLIPLEDGGFLGVLVGVQGRVRPTRKIPLRPATSIGLQRFDAKARPVGGVKWIVSKRNQYYSFPQLAPLGNGRFLLGYAESKRLNDRRDKGHDAYRIPWAYYLQEIDVKGRSLLKPQKLRGAGWGEQDQLISLGKGRVGWAYIPQATLGPLGERPSCNSRSLQLSVYSRK